MYDTSTVFYGNVIHAGHEKCFLAAFRLYKRHQLFVFDILQHAALHFFQDFVCALAQYFIRKRFRNIEYIARFFTFIHLCFDIVDVRTNGQHGVGRQGPRGCGPCQEIFVVRVFPLEFAD